MAASEEQFLSLEDVASRLQVSDQTVRRWVKSGKLTAYKPGLEYRIREADLEEFLRAREVRPKAPRRSPSEPSFNDVLEDERRLRYLRAWRAFVRGLARRWEQQPPKTEAEITPLFEAMTAVVEQGVFNPPEEVGASEGYELTLLTFGFQRLNEIADKVEQDEQAEQRRAAFQVIQEQQEQRSA